MPLNRAKEICSRSRDLLKALSCLLEITTLKLSQQQQQHVVKKRPQPSLLLIPLVGGGGGGEERGLFL